jgi:hypothetical protein
VVAEALAAAEAGQALPVGDASALGRRIRTWAVEAAIPGRLRNDPAASLDAQRRHANLLGAAGQLPRPAPEDPSRWLTPQRVDALRRRSLAAQAVRAALFADPRPAVSATLEQLRYLPGDSWAGIRASALARLRRRDAPAAGR